MERERELNGERENETDKGMNERDETERVRMREVRVDDKEKGKKGDLCMPPT